MCDLGIIMNKMSIEIAESEERLGFFDFSGAWPFRDALYFGGVHADISCRDNDSKVFDSSLIKGAFFWLEVQVIFRESL